MTKQAFLDQLRKRLSGLSREEIAEQLAFYSEMIDDRMEEGLSESDAVAAVGFPAEIADQVTTEKTPAKRRLKAGEIVLLVLGSPLWVSLLAAVAAVVLSVYVSLWAAVGSLWSVFASLVVCTIFTVAAGVGLLFAGSGFAGIALLGAALVCAGLSVFLFFGCRAVTKGICRLTVQAVRYAKNRLGKRGAQHG